MKKRELLRLLNKKQSEVADLLGITRSAVTQWRDEVPNESYLTLRYQIFPHLHWPEVFTNSNSTPIGATCQAQNLGLDL